MTILNNILNATTFGGYNRFKDSKSRYETAYAKYKSSYSKQEKISNECQSRIVTLGENTIVAFRTLDEAQILLRATEHSKIIPNVGTNHLQIPSNKLLVTELSIKDYRVLAEGASVGSVAAVGSWSLVALLGTASTGTSIATLSGVAATNATLAWFGGGALAAGGAGMAGGSLVLGGIAIIPLIAYCTWSSHSKSKQLDQETDKLTVATGEAEANSISLLQCYEIISAQVTQLNAVHRRLHYQLGNATRLLLPYGWLSKLWRYIRSICGRGYYLESENCILIPFKQEVERFTAYFHIHAG